MAKKRRSYKPKSKMGKSSPNGKISNKIRILKKEGYSQKQAIAIALYMKRTNKI